MGFLDWFARRRQNMPEPTAKSSPQEAWTEQVQLAGSTAVEEVTNLASLARRQQLLLDSLRPVSNNAGRTFFRKLGVQKPNEYSDAINAFSSFRSFVLSSEGSAVHTWYLDMEPSSDGPHALYVHVDDPVIPIGFAVCKLATGSFLGYYTTGSGFKDRLGL